MGEELYLTKRWMGKIMFRLELLIDTEQSSSSEEWDFRVTNIINRVR